MSFEEQRTTPSEDGERPPSTLRIDVDRLGVVALEATSRYLELLPLRRPNARESARPETILFACSHLTGASSATCTPTFPARDPNDRRVRQHGRLRAGEVLVRALIHHIGVNNSIRILKVTAAPLRHFDWQGLSASLLHNRCPLRELSLAGSRLGDKGLCVLGPALLAHPSLTALNLDGCGLTAESACSIIAVLQNSNVRQNEGRRRTELNTWAGGLRSYRKPRRGAPAPPAPTRENADEVPIGVTTLGLAGNDLNEQGGMALANHLMQDCWLESLDLRYNGIGHGGLKALREAAGEREISESERLTVVPRLEIRLEGNAEDIDAAVHGVDGRRRSTRPQSARSRSSSGSGYAYGNVPTRPPRSAREADARRQRAAILLRRKTASVRTAQLDITLRALDPKRAGPLTKDGWDTIAEACGGVTPMLDAMEEMLEGLMEQRLAGASLEDKARVVAAVQAAGGLGSSMEQGEHEPP